MLAAQPSRLPSVETVLTGGGVALLVMGVLWVVQQRTRNAAWADFGWTVCIGLLGVACAVWGAGEPARRFVCAALVGTWSLRLATHLWRDRLVGRPEEGRYVRMRAYLGTRAGVGFFLFFVLQGVLATVLVLPFFLSSNAATGLGWSDVAALVLFALALVGEHVADQQLSRFKARKDSNGQVCQVGLWRYSRHPNYFFEWLAWCAFALLAWPSAYGIWAWSAPAIMLLFILKISGVPTSERQALSSRGDAYRAYQRSTSVFVPWPPNGERV